MPINFEKVTPKLICSARVNHSARPSSQRVLARLRERLVTPIINGQIPVKPSVKKEAEALETFIMTLPLDMVKLVGQDHGLKQITAEYGIAICTDKGDRSSNQDSAAAVIFEDQVRLVLADGAGGVAGGDIASALAVDHFISPYRKARSLTKAIESCHGHIISWSLGDLFAPRKRPGTTISAVIIDPLSGRAESSHIGDSPIYLFRRSDQAIWLLNQPHMYHLKQYDGAEINAWFRSEKEKMRYGLLPAGLLHPPYNEDVIRYFLVRRSQVGKNLLSAMAGSILPPIMEKVTFTLRPGDRLLICSDGLNLSRKRMRKYLSSYPLADVAEGMIEENEKMNGVNGDNITVLLYEQNYTTAVSSHQPQGTANQ